MTWESAWCCCCSQLALSGSSPDRDIALILVLRCGQLYTLQPGFLRHLNRCACQLGPLTLIPASDVSSYMIYRLNVRN